jgi:capsular polysaccharide biosynthesis protein
VLTNEAEVEDILAARGFAVISPEALPFAAQVRLVAGASRVVGCFGSQLHLSMFMAPGARKLVIGRERFLGPDETLIAIGNGTAVDYVVEPQGRAGADASEDEDWTLDLARFERAVDRWLAG